MKGLTILRNCLAEILNAVPFLALQMVLMNFGMNGNFNKLWLLVPALVPLLFYFIRCKCHGFFLFTVLHLLVLALLGGLYAQTLIERILLLAVAVIQMLVSIHTRVTKEHWESTAAVPVAIVALVGAVYIADGTQTGGLSGTDLIQLIIAYLILYLLYHYLEHFLHYIDMNSRTTENLPVKSVFRTSAVLAAVFTAFAAVFISMVENNTLAQFFNRGIRWLLVKVISFFLYVFSLLQMKTTPLEPGPMNDMSTGLMHLEEQQPSWLVRILEVLLSAFACGLALFIVGTILYNLIRLIYYGFKRGEKKNNTQKKEEMQDIVEKVSAKKKTKKELKWNPLANTYNERIRRLYYRTLLKTKNGKPTDEELAFLAKATARECAKDFIAGEAETGKEFAMLYEKARYGEMACSKEDLKRTKELARQLL